MGQTARFVFLMTRTKKGQSWRAMSATIRVERWSKPQCQLTRGAGGPGDTADESYKIGISMKPSYDLDKIKFATDRPTFEKAIEIYSSGGVKNLKLMILVLPRRSVAVMVFFITYMFPQSIMTEAIVTVMWARMICFASTWLPWPFMQYKVVRN